MAEEQKNTMDTIASSLQAATSVALHNRQQVEIIDAKVDTVGVTTVSNIKTAQEIKEKVGKVHTQLNKAMDTQSTLVDSVQATSNRVETLATSYENTTFKLSDIKTNLETLDNKIETSVDDLKHDITTVSETYLNHVNSFNDRTSDLSELVKGLDYKAEITNLSTLVQELNASVVELSNHNNEQYQFASDKLNLLEVAVASIMQATKEYRGTLDVLAEQVKTFDAKLDAVDEAVYQLRIKPTMAAQDQILETFKSWGATRDMFPDSESEEVVVESTSESVETSEVVSESEVLSETTSESVFEHITLPEPEEPVQVKPKQKRGFFSKLLG